MKKPFKQPKIPWIVLLVVLSSCVHIAVYDKLVCGDLGADGAHCNYTLHSEKIDIPKQRWDEKRFGWMCMSSESFNDTETAMDQLCNGNNKCKFKNKKILDDINDSLKKGSDRVDWD